MNALMKASAEFVQNNVFVKSIDKTDPENHPKTKQGERSNPGKASAPCIWKIGTPVSEQLIKNKWWENEYPNNWPLDEHAAVSTTKSTTRSCVVHDVRVRI